MNTAPSRLNLVSDDELEQVDGGVLWLAVIAIVLLYSTYAGISDTSSSCTCGCTCCK